MDRLEREYRRGPRPANQQGVNCDSTDLWTIDAESWHWRRPVSL